MEKQPIIIAEEIHLVKIDIVQSKIDVGRFKDAKQINFGISHKMMHNLKDERVKMELAFSFKNEKDAEVVFFQIDFHFQIERMKNFYNLKDGEVPMFYGLMVATILGISLSTARGIIYEKLSTNGIVNVIIPVVSPQSMLNPNVALEE